MSKVRLFALVGLASLGVAVVACDDGPNPATVASGLCSEMGQARATGALMREQALSAVKAVGEGARMTGAEAEESARAKLTVQRVSWQNAGKAHAWCAAATMNDAAMSRLAVTLEQTVGGLGDPQALRNLRSHAARPQGAPTVCDDIEALSKLTSDYDQRVIAPVETWVTQRNEANDAIVDACRTFARSL